MDRPRRQRKERKITTTTIVMKRTRESKVKCDAWRPARGQSHGHTHSYVSQVISMQSEGGGEPGEAAGLAERHGPGWERWGRTRGSSLW